FEVAERLPVSFFRAGLFKNLLPIDTLVAADSLLQQTGLFYAPSIFVHGIARGMASDHLSSSDIFACPDCGKRLRREEDQMVCEADGLRWAIRDGIYDFKAPLE
ncbi:MAG: hypothetical protein K8J31_10215, partial [Anaerolineae bacterium]|nr:hypothetical protein [Anaerolineae bacterium]